MITLELYEFSQLLATHGIPNRQILAANSDIIIRNSAKLIVTLLVIKLYLMDKGSSLNYRAESKNVVGCDNPARQASKYYDTERLWKAGTAKGWRKIMCI